MLKALVLLAAVFLDGNETVQSSPRHAALRFALANGLELPSGPKIVASDNRWGVLHLVEPARPLDELARETNTIKEDIKAQRVGRADALLRCVDLSRCAPLNVGETVIVVNDSQGSKPAKLLLMVFMPPNKPDEYDSRVAIALVEVRPQGSGWVGVRYAQPLAFQDVRLVKR